jgi:hypothetical protein
MRWLASCMSGVTKNPYQHPLVRASLINYISPMGDALTT